MRLICLLFAVIASSARGAIARMDTLEPGETRTGRLEATDRPLPGRGYGDGWGFIGVPGQEVTIDLSSTDFDTYLVLVRPDGTRVENDDGGEGTNSQIAQRVRIAGRYSIIVSSYAAGATGPYLLTLSEGMPEPPPDPEDFTFTAATIPLPQSGTVEGSLGPGDSHQQSGRYVDTYEFHGLIGHTLTIEMKSVPLDSHITLITPGGEEIINDDAEPGVLDSRLETTLSESGVFRLRCSTYNPNTTGAYSLAVRDTTRMLTPGQPAMGVIGEEVREITYLLPDLPENFTMIEAALSAGGSEADLDLELMARASEDELGEPGWLTVASSRGFGADERLRFTSDFTNPLLLRVSTHDEALVPFSLSAAEVDAAEILQPGNPAQGTLTSDWTTRVYRFQASREGFVVARVEMKDTPVELSMRVNGGPVVSGVYGSLAPHVVAGDEVTVAVEPLWVSGAEPLPFVLDVELVSESQAVQADGVVVNGSLTGDETAVHRIMTGPGDLGGVWISSEPPGAIEADLIEGGGVALNRLEPRSPARTLMYSPNAPEQQIVIRRARWFDGPVTYHLSAAQGDGLHLPTLAPNAPQPINFTGECLGRATVPIGGLYRVTVKPASGERTVELELTGTDDSTAFDDGEDDEPVSAFRYFEAGTDVGIRVGSDSAFPVDATLELQSITQEPLAAANATAEMWGVFVGVANYPDDRDDLPHCDDDAAVLLNTLRTRNAIRRDHTVLLTNANATRGAIQAALESLEGRVGPEDSLVFLFSGHGGQDNEAEEGTEADEHDEFFCPYDSSDGGDIYDDEFNEWLSAIPAELQMVFIDSCNSGGFRDELTRREGRVVLLASEEDLLSFTYEEYKAGGILTHLLARAFTGEADLDGDGEIIAGELSDFVLTQMPTITISDDEHSGRLAQHPVSSRTVPYETVLVTLP